jgi:ketosteroid isomerase-like protein
MSEDSTNSHIEQALSAWTSAELRGDTAALDRLLTPDFTGAGPLGFLLSKPDWLARHAPGQLAYETYELSETQQHLHGDTAVVVTRQIARGTHRGHPVPEQLRATLVLIETGGDWRLLSLHYSFIAGTPGAPAMPGRN